MRLRYVAPPWGAPNLTDEAKELVSLLADNTWAGASVDFYAERDAKIRAGKRPPKGMQKTLNSVIGEKLTNSGWEGDLGYYVKGDTWFRVTFRHQMGVGSDLLDAMKVCKKEGIRLAIIAAASRDALREVSPEDCGSMMSFEKLQSEVIGLEGVLDIPLLIAELTPLTRASQMIEDELRKPRRHK